MPTFLSLSKFSDVLKSLELGGYINRNKLIAMPEDVARTIYGEQPGISSAIARLDLALNDKEYSFLDPEKEFNTLIRELVLVARMDSTSSRNEITHQAAYLAGFLLHHRFEIEFDEDLKNVKSMNMIMSEHFPTRRYSLDGRKLVLVPPANFQIPQWRNEQQYPSLFRLSAIWSAFQQKLEKQQQNQQQALQQAQHYFDGRTLTFKEFSFALEGLIKTGFVTLPQDYFASRNSDLSVDMARLVTAFSRNARSGLVTPQELTHQLLILLKTIQGTAANQSSAKRLYGFLLHHDFAISCPAGTIKMSKILGNDLVAQRWRNVKNIPGRDDLSKALLGQNQNSYLPSFRQAPRRDAPMAGVRRAARKVQSNRHVSAPYLKKL